MQRVDVAVQPPYPVFIADTWLEQLSSHIPEHQLAIISDSNVAAHYMDAVQRGLTAAGKQVTCIVIDPGEASKSLRCYGEVLGQLLRAGHDRHSAVLALGGGVVGDLAGFVAASLMRGVAFYQCPTSLLAMVDASVGGKTGINMPEGKNLVGAFWQPRAVCMDVAVLRTLPEREFRQGSVELFKHGLLADAEILQQMASADYRRNAAADFWTALIGRSVKVKANIVAQDEREAGARAFLNLGHTLAHALEAHSQQRLAHGDAVAYGLLFVSQLAALRGYADEKARVEAFVTWLQPDPLPTTDFAALLPYLKRDKKNRAGTQRWVLLEALGKPCIVEDIAEAELAQAWRYLCDVAEVSHA